MGENQSGLCLNLEKNMVRVAAHVFRPIRFGQKQPMLNSQSDQTQSWVNRGQRVLSGAIEILSVHQKKKCCRTLLVTK